MLPVQMNPIELTEFSIYLHQRPGELAGLLDAAKAGGVEIISISTTEHLDRGCVRLLGYPESALRQICESMVDAGVGPVVEGPVVGVLIEDRPGIIRDLVVLMADNRVNVRYCYFVPASKVSQGTMCVFRFDEHERAIETIRQADWAPAGHEGTETHQESSDDDESDESAA